MNPSKHPRVIEFQSFIPKKVDKILTKTLMTGLDPKVASFYEELYYKGWSFYASDFKRASGLCYSSGTILVSVAFLLSASKGQKMWLLSHEMAHAYAGIENQHNQVFMEWLKKICPKECIHYELSYKPRNASKAGILPIFDDIEL